MAFDIHRGVWPTMITPFSQDNRVDYDTIEKMCEWYIEKGCSGIFAVCQSSEMAYLAPEEKIKIADTIVKTVRGRMQVIASGHTADDQQTQFQELEAMMKTGVEAFVLISNRLDPKNEGEQVFRANANSFFDRYPEVSFGIYECPMPYKRLVSTPFLSAAAKSGKMVFLKDTCCDQDLIKERLDAIRGTSLKLFNANAATLYSSLQNGCAGYNGVMANFHPELYKWVVDNIAEKPREAHELADFLTLAAMIEMRVYPVNAKYHMSLCGIPMSTVTRSADASRLDKNARLEVESLLAAEQLIRERLSI